MFSMIVLIWHLACSNDPVCSSLFMFDVRLLLPACIKLSFILCKTTLEQNSSHVIVCEVFFMFLIILAEGFLEGVYLESVCGLVNF